MKSISFSLKPTVSVIALSLAAAFALTACGGGGGGSDNNAGGGGGGGGDGVTQAIGYVTQFGAGDGTGSILRCDTASDGMLTCTPSTDASATTLPGPIAIALAGGNAYVLNSAEGGEAIYKCAVTDGAVGAISACAEEAGAGEEEIVEQIVGAKDLAANGNNLYVLKDQQVLKCGITDGTVGACNDEGITVTGLGVAESLAFSGNRIWIADSGGDAGSIRTCEVANGDGGTGGISGCADSGWTATGVGNPSPMGIAVSSTNAYIVLRDTNSVQRCVIGETGGAVALTCDEAVSLATATIGDAQPYRIALNGNYAYITNASETEASNSSVIKCNIGSGGAIEATSCVSAVTASDTSPITGEVTDIAF